MKALEFCMAVAAASLLIVQPATRAEAGSHAIRVDSAIADTTISTLEWTCDPNTGLPIPGDAACVGIETIGGTISGDLEATYLSEANFAVLSSGEAPYTGFLVVSGTIPGLGSGSFTILEVGRIAASGALESRWRVVAGSGSGDFVGILGGGKIQGTYDPTTGLGRGRMLGTLHVKP